MSELVRTSNNLKNLVEGPDWLDWRDKNGRRLKDTNEWCQFYVALNDKPDVQKKGPSDE
tara:strand:+ start:17533 stop:17709 length:177 start_codon:yes stop_codon:yes gene_type:complete